MKESVRGVQRIGMSNGRVTKGKIYKISPHNGKIIDDRGGEMRPTRNPHYWREVDYSPLDVPAIMDAVNNNLKKKEDSVMSKINIKKAILINGVDSDSLSVDDILGLIENEENMINRLDNFKTASVAISNLIKMHDETVVQLVEIIDGREGKDTPEVKA